MLVLAVPIEDAAKVRSTRGFRVEVLSLDATLEAWHEVQIGEHLEALLALPTPAALAAFAAAMKGQQRFRHFGGWYRARRLDRESGEVLEEGRKSAGGGGRSGSRPAGAVRCPRCGGTNLNADGLDDALII